MECGNQVVAALGDVVRNVHRHNLLSEGILC